MTVVFCVCCVVLLVHFIQCTIIKTACPFNEIHRSCSFYEEYTCWDSNSQVERVLNPAKKLDGCKPGCFCKAGLVRNYPGGICILAHRCRDLHVLAILKERNNNAEIEEFE